MKSIAMILCSLFLSHVVVAVNIAPIDSIHDMVRYSVDTDNRLSTDKKKILLGAITPSILMGYGLSTMRNHKSTHLNYILREELQGQNPRHLTLDDYTQYAPLFSYLTFDLVGISAKHSLKRRLITGAASHAIMAAAVNIMKAHTNVMRPDGSSDNSFPSGHTATAFVGAELFWQEYHDQSIWYGVGGYAVAAATGFFRMHNDRHWLSDVAMGAGIAILSTKLTYWVLPVVEQRFQHTDKNYTIIPTYDGRYVQATFRMQM